ncbi:MAG: transglycosylase SLT domain-containing protein [Candidatus Acidiferrales bacterium]|jgi:soluble lytic murein transglycosylase
MHNGSLAAYMQVGAFADKHASDVWGARAALALAYFDSTNSHAQQSLTRFEKAERDPLLREYVLYWRAQAKRSLGREAEALADFETLRADFPESVMSEQTVEALAATAVNIGKARQAIAALDDYPGTASKPPLLSERARARQVAGELDKAAADYQTIYYRYPLSDEAQSVGGILQLLARKMGGAFPHAAPDQQEKRAETFFDARKWREARVEYEKLLATIGKSDASPQAQRAHLRVAQARFQLGGSPKLIEAVRTPDPAVDAERLYSLSQAWRPKPREAPRHERDMFAALAALDAKYTDSRANEDGLYAAANYFWAQLDRKRAADGYRKLLTKFPGGRYAQTADWRVAWIAHLNRQPEAKTLFEEFVGKYPGSAYIANALYWLGRIAERDGDAARARGIYLKAEDRFPETYFGMQASSRILALGREPVNSPEFLEKIAAPPPLRRLDEPIPAAAIERWTRAQVLRTLAFDASAELELRAAYFASSNPRRMLEAAQAALDQGHYGVAMALGRIAVPNFEARHIDEVPMDAWKTLFPLPYESALRDAAEKNGVDAMLAAGLMRQESTFQPDAVSKAGAVGLMQVLPKTGRLVSRQVHVRYARAKLNDPEYNLLLGMRYFADLLRTQGSPEAALGAFNAGEDRVASWQAERHYDELPEFVESIPFTETREYIQIVLRNAAVYRMIYGGKATAGSSR